MLNFRKAKRIEVLEIYELIQQTIEETYPKYYPFEVAVFFKEMHNEKRILTDIFEESVWVLLDDTKLIGTCTCIENVIMRLFVKPEFQSQGYGKYILDQIEKMILNNHDRIILEAVISASRMYEKRGYRTLNHEKLIISESTILCYEVMQLDKE